MTLSHITDFNINTSIASVIEPDCRLREQTDSILKWSRSQLLVSKSSAKSEITSRNLLDEEQNLVKQLRSSFIKSIIIDIDLGETLLRRWADISQKAKKAIFFNIPTANDLPQERSPLSWSIKRVCDCLGTALILLALSPVFLIITLLMLIYSPGPIFFWQWRVGEGGKLFRICKFRTMMVDAEKFHHQVMGDQSGLHKLQSDPRITPLGKLMRKYSIDELPQLFNVLCGEMSLVGPRPWALYDAVRISSDYQHRLNALPGITGAWQVSVRSTLLDLDAVSKYDIEYLKNWTLILDLKILLMTIPKVLSGFGAY